MTRSRRTANKALKPIRLHISKVQCRNLTEGKGIMIGPEHVPIHPQCKKTEGGHITYLSRSMQRKMHKLLHCGARFKLLMPPHAVARSIRRGGVHWGSGIVADTLEKARAAAAGGSAEDIDARIGQAIKEMLASLDKSMLASWNEPIWHQGEGGIKAALIGLKTGIGTFESWAAKQRANGVEPSPELYRLERLELWSTHQAELQRRTAGNNTLAGFFKGAWQAIVHQAPLSLALVAHTIGSVVPGTGSVMSKVASFLNPDGKPLPHQALGGIAEKAFDLAPKATGKVTGAGLRRRAPVFRKSRSRKAPA